MTNKPEEGALFAVRQNVFNEMIEVLRAIVGPTDFKNLTTGPGSNHERARSVIIAACEERR